MSRQLEEQITGHFPVGRRLRVLDVGMGRGAQALRLARAGHQVTGLEQDASLTATAHKALAEEPEGIRGRVRIIEGQAGDTGVHFLPGSFDVVLCHGMLMDVEEPDALLAGVARVLAHGGLLSLVVRNGDAVAMRAGLCGDWDAALMGLSTAACGLKRLTSTLAGIGAPLHTWYGVRVFTDAVSREAEVPANLPTLLEVEDRAGRTDPYRGVASLLHLCGVRG